jgi:methionyl aminopeptidase
MHEDPEMPNYGKRGRENFIEGMVVAIEPMINLEQKTLNSIQDGWTITTADNKT